MLINKDYVVEKIPTATHSHFLVITDAKSELNNLARYKESVPTQTHKLDPKLHHR